VFLYSLRLIVWEGKWKTGSSRNAGAFVKIRELER